MGKTKGFRNHKSRVQTPKHRYRLYIFYILYQKLYQKSTCFRRNSGPCVQTFFVIPLMRSKESTGSGFELQHKLCFLAFYTRNYTKIHICFKHQNRLLPPMSTLSQLRPFGFFLIRNFLVEKHFQKNYCNFMKNCFSQTCSHV